MTPKLDIAVHKGDIARPAVVFVHGLGMDKSFFARPEDARVLGGLFPLEAMSRKKGKLRTLYHDLAEAGLTVLTWSQGRPAGPAEAATEELLELLKLLREMGHKEIALIGHSRGGVIVRAASAALPALPVLAGRDMPRMKALVTISSPHHGSSMAKWAVYLSPLAQIINPLLPPESGKWVLARSLKRTAGFLSGRAVRELLPGSDFLKSLSDEKPADALCISIGGTDPSLIDVKGIFSMPGSIEKLIPGRLLPEEMTTGKGDGLVSARSAELPFADQHLNFPLNHVETALDESVREAVIERMKRVL